jgi:hypothetical protein
MVVKVPPLRRKPCSLLMASVNRPTTWPELLMPDRKVPVPMPFRTAQGSSSVVKTPPLKCRTASCSA